MTGRHRHARTWGEGLTLSGSSVLVTGGTGSFGREFVRELLDQQGAQRVVVFSRDELKQHEMRVGGFSDPRLRWFIGDVRDEDRLERAMAGVDVVVHAAAMKQVPACEDNPLEAVRTNVGGAESVVNAALNVGVGRVLGISTDKACDPVNLYGTTKRLMEGILVHSNVYAGKDGTRFSCVRYGNVLSSRGSVLPLFLDAHARCEPLRVTDPSMTRFVLTLAQGVAFVVDSLARMSGGEIFVPRLPAVTVETIAQAATWPREPDLIVTGMRPGEKKHEVLVSEHEAPRTAVDTLADWGSGHYVIHRTRPPLALREGYRFSSDTAPRLGVEELRALAGLGPSLKEAA